MTIGIIGVGHLAAALLDGFLRSGLDPAEVILSPRGEGPALAARHGFRLAADNAEVVHIADVVVLAVRPAAAVAAVTDLPFRAGQLLVSACAGVPTATLVAAAPAATVVRIMPLTAASIGASPTLMFPADPEVAALLARLGTVVPLEREDQFEVATVSAAVYGWAQALIAGAADWAAANGLDPATARELSARTFVAAGRMVAEDPAPTDALIAALATPGGITEAGLNHLRDAGVPAAWTGACDIVLARLRRS